MDDQNKNLILATALSFLVILGWTVFFAPPPAPEDPNAPAQVEQTAPDGGVAADDLTIDQVRLNVRYPWPT